jgi:nucleotide-binding universal stress UspA family protein
VVSRSHDGSLPAGDENRFQRKECVMRRILIATDGSDGACAAVQEGVELAAEVGAEVTFVTVRPRVSGLLGDALYQRQLTEQLAQARAAIDAAEAEARRVGVTYESDVLEGDAAERIAQAARGWSADLVVVGSRGHGSVASAVIGSVSRALLTRSPAPVMVVRTRIRTTAAA